MDNLALFHFVYHMVWLNPHKQLFGHLWSIDQFHPFYNFPPKIFIFQNFKQKSPVQMVKGLISVFKKILVAAGPYSVFFWINII